MLQARAGESKANEKKQRYLGVYRWMLLARVLEDRVASLYRGGKISGGVRPPSRCPSKPSSSASARGVPCHIGMRRRASSFPLLNQTSRSASTTGFSTRVRRDACWQASSSFSKSPRRSEETRPRRDLDGAETPVNQNGAFAEACTVHKSAACQATRSYSCTRPPRRSRRLIATSASGSTLQSLVDQPISTLLSQLACFGT